MVQLCKTHLAIMVYGIFLKWGYPEIIHFNVIFPCKPSIWGYPDFRKPPYHRGEHSLPKLGGPSIPLSSMTPQLNRCRTPSTYTVKIPGSVDRWMVNGCFIDNDHVAKTCQDNHKPSPKSPYVYIYIILYTYIHIVGAINHSQMGWFILVSTTLTFFSFMEGFI